MRAAVLVLVGVSCGCNVFLPGVWLDTQTGLMWEEPGPGDKLTFDEATTHCAELTTDGHTDWRLPNINELRSLIRGCLPDCNVWVDCNSNSYNDGCYTNCLDGCFDEKGPGGDGCYWNEIFSGSCNNYWSSTPVTGTVSTGTYFWVIDFSDATFSYINTNELEQNVRCVRTDT